MPGQVMLFSSAAFLFMLLLMWCGSGGVVCAGEVKPVSQSNSLELFKKGETMVDGSATVAVTSFRAHSLVDVNGLIVAFAETNSNCDELCCNAGLWSKSFRYEKDKMPPEIIKAKDGNQWMAQAVVSKETKENHCTQLSGPSAVVKDNKIYILLSMLEGLKNSNYSSALLRNLELVVGTVATPTDCSPNRITWQPSKSQKDTLKDKPPTGSSGYDLFVLIGRGIVMGDGTILFPLGFHKLYDEKVKCTVIYSEDDGDNWNFHSEKIIDEDCEHATLLEWEGKLLMITTSSSSRTRKVYVSADKGKTWAEDGESGSSLLVDFLKCATSGVENGMTTATINGKNLTLLSQRAISSGSGDLGQVHLFMTDNKRITSVGPISLDQDISSDCKLLHTKENGGLFALCNKGSRESQTVVLLSLTEQLERIKSVLESWESTDGKVSKICISATKENPCSTPMPTRGLVGFLSDTGNDTHWADEYLGVNATVTGATKVENGFKFLGSCAFIVWRFGKEYGTPLYSFADRGLTLVATVTIHDTTESDTLLMSVGLTKKTVGLWHDKKNHRKGIIGGDGKENTSWEKDKSYQVVITLLNGNRSLYINGKRLGGLDPNSQPNKDGKAQGSRDVSHGIKEEVRYICFGKCPFINNGYPINTGSSFTVTNVFLYNRVLTEAELPPPPPPPPPSPSPPRQQDQNQSTAEGKKETTTTGNSTVEEPAYKPPQHEQEQSQCTAKETRETTTTGKPTDEESTDTTPAGNDSSVHESLSSLFHLFSLLAFVGSASL